MQALSSYYRMYLTAMLAAALGSGMTGCRHQNPYALKKEYQALQAKNLKPAELEPKQHAWRSFRTMRVRVYADAAFRKKEGNVRGYFEEQLERVNLVLEPALRLRLQIEDVREMQALAASADLDLVLRALEQADPASDVDLIVGLTGASPVMTLSFHDLGRAHVLAAHLVLRTMDDAAELRAIHEGFDTLSAEERSRLYQQRKRHKQTTVLLHELGHVLGAIHTRDLADLMHASYDNTMQQYAAPNLELMRYVVDEKTAEPAQRDFGALVARLESYLDHSDWQGWDEAERTNFRAELERVAKQGSAKAAQKAALPEPARQAAEPAEDLTPLPDADQTRYREIDAQLKAERWADAWKTATDLADHHLDSYPLQRKACELGMRLSLSHRQLKPYCDRMTALSMHQPAR